MNEATKITKEWLDRRFSQSNEEGIYFAHQPIYGFRKGHSEPGIFNRYVITYGVMKALGHMQFTALLDAGGGEGYMAALARRLFGVKVQMCDLSVEACCRAKELFGIEGVAADIQTLPFRDNEFDCVICSQTLEHIPDFQGAVKELYRVSRKAVIITVPVESEQYVADYVGLNEPHPHLHSLDVNSLDFMSSTASKILVKKMVSPLLRTTLLDAVPQENIRNFGRFWVTAYNMAAPLLRTIFNKYMTAMLIRLDEALSCNSKGYRDLLFIILKDENSYSLQCRKAVSALQILDFEVPYHSLPVNPEG